MVHAFDDLRYAAVRNCAFDAYCMQHIEPYCHSAKSYAAHLTRLCCGIEYGGDGQGSRGDSEMVKRLAFR
ncbi:MAG: hypothetical protein NVS4B8_30120 [Herpetosiphon sp.]